MKQILITLFLLISLATAGSASALDPVYTGFFSDEAIKGYDPVAYFTENKPVKGSEDYSFEYKGAQWLFSSKENLEMFKNNPGKYEPQYGGYCAYAVSQNKTASIKPELFTIHEGKLYLNYNASINEKWRKQKDSFIEAADKNWPGLLAN